MQSSLSPNNGIDMESGASELNWQMIYIYNDSI